MAELRQQSGAGIGGIAQAIAALAPVFLGSGKQTSTQTQTPTVDAAAIEGLRKTAATAQANADNDEITDSIVSDIMRRATLSFAPVVGQEKQAGLYSSSTLRQLSEESKANATAAASKAVLDYKTSQSQVAAGANSAIAQVTKGGTTTTTGKAAPTVPAGASFAALAALAGTSIFKNKDDILDFFNSSGGDAGGTSGAGTGISTGSDASITPEFLDAFLKANPNAFNLSAPSSPDVGDSETGIAGGTGTFGSSGVDSLDTSVSGYDKSQYGDSPVSFRDVSRGLGVAGMLGQSPALGFAGTGLKAIDSLMKNDPLTGTLKAGLGIASAIMGGPAGLIGGFAGDWLIDKIFGKGGTPGVDTPFGVDSLTGTLDSGSFGPDSFGPGGNAIDNAGSLAKETGIDTSLSIGNDLGASLGGWNNDIGGFNTGVDSVDTDLGGSGGSFGDDSVVCTEAVKQGIISQELMEKEVAINRKRIGATALRGYHFYALDFVCSMRERPEAAKFYGNWAKAYCEHITGDRKNLVGFLTKWLGEPFAWIIGATVARKDQDYKSLYRVEGSN